MKCLIPIFVMWSSLGNLHAFEGGHGGGPRERNTIALRPSFSNHSSFDTVSRGTIPQEFQRQIEGQDLEDQESAKLIDIYVLMIQKEMKDSP